MGVDVNEAGGHDHSGRVDLILARSFNFADRHDPAVPNRDIPFECITTRSVEDLGISNDNIHFGFPHGPEPGFAAIRSSRQVSLFDNTTALLKFRPIGRGAKPLFIIKSYDLLSGKPGAARRAAPVTKFAARLIRIFSFQEDFDCKSWSMRYIHCQQKFS
jgi:hypothetical protein